MNKYEQRYQRPTHEERRKAREAVTKFFKNPKNREYLRKARKVFKEKYQDEDFEVYFKSAFIGAVLEKMKNPQQKEKNMSLAKIVEKVSKSEYFSPSNKKGYASIQEVVDKTDFSWQTKQSIKASDEWTWIESKAEKREGWKITKRWKNGRGYTVYTVTWSKDYREKDKSSDLKWSQKFYRFKNVSPKKNQFGPQRPEEKEVSFGRKSKK